MNAIYERIENNVIEILFRHLSADTDMTNNDQAVPKHNNRGFNETHMLLIEKACELISESAQGGISISALAKVTGVNRSTVYNHFKTREDLLCAAQNRSREQPTANAETDTSGWVGINELSALFQDNPEVMTSWIDDYIAEADLHERYPHWDRLIAQIKYTCSDVILDKPYDAEVYWALMLASTPAVANSVHSSEGLEDILGIIRARAACADRNGSA